MDVAEESLNGEIEKEEMPDDEMQTEQPKSVTYSLACESISSRRELIVYVWWWE